VDLDVGDAASPEKRKEMPANGDPDVGTQGLDGCRMERGRRCGGCVEERKEKMIGLDYR